MLANHFRYQLYIKRAVLQAHVAAMDHTINEIEYDNDAELSIQKDNYRLDEEECFAKYWQYASEVE